MERFNELFRLDATLLEHPVQCSNFHFTVHRHDASSITASHHHMASTLPD
jgi:hypothetical protein